MASNMGIVGKMLIFCGFFCFLYEARAQKPKNNPSLCFYNYYYGNTNDKAGSFEAYSKCNLEGYREFKSIIRGNADTQEIRCAKAVDALFYIDPVWASYAKVREYNKGSTESIPVTVRERILNNLNFFCLDEVYKMMYKDDGKRQRSLFSGLNSDWKTSGLSSTNNAEYLKNRKMRFLLLKAAYPMDSQKKFRPINHIFLSPYLSEVYYRKSDLMRYYNAVKYSEITTTDDDYNKRAQNILLPILFRKNMNDVHDPDYFRLDPSINRTDGDRINKYPNKFRHVFRRFNFFKKSKMKCSYYFVKNIRDSITYGNYMNNNNSIDKKDNYYFHWCMSGYLLAGVNKMSYKQFNLDQSQLYRLDPKYLKPFNSWEQFVEMNKFKIAYDKSTDKEKIRWVKKYLNKTEIDRKDFVFRCRNFGGEHANKKTLTKRCVAHFIREKAIREWAKRIEKLY